MTQRTLRNPDWYRAIRLEERLATLRARSADAPASSFDESLARSELDHWRSQSPFDDPNWFAKRLEVDDLQEQELLGLLGEAAEDVRDRSGEPPAWLATLERAWTEHGANGDSALPLPEEMAEARTVAFLDALRPLVAAGRAQLEHGIAELVRRHGNLPFDPAEIVEPLLVQLPWRLHVQCCRTMVLELNVARLQGELAGDTPEERFRSFVERVGRPEAALGLLAEYPVLARQAVETVDRWAQFALELLGHLCEDWTELREKLLVGDDPGPLLDVRAGAGDLHRGGRSVGILTFASGARLVYKPRSMSIDVHFGELLDWVNRNSDLPPLRTARVLDRENHGWAEFIEAAPCTDDAAAQRFYRRQGAFLALLHALQATDFHYENLIASGEHPVLVDLESLFHPHLAVVEPEQPDLRLMNNAMAHSVLRIGLLPQRTWATEEHTGVDLSGLGGAGGQTTPEKVLQWEGVGTDEMHAVRQRMEMPGGQNQPRLEGRALTPLDYVEEIVAGFEGTYRLMMERREELLAPGGPLERFAGDEIRAVLRATRGYALLLMESYHPDFQRDALELERFFDRLWVGVPDNEHLVPVVPAERADLLEGDVPIFTTRVASRDIFTSRGERIPDFWPESGLDLVRRQITGFSDASLARQVWFVRASLATLSLNDDDLRWPTLSPVEPGPVPPADELRERAIDAARELGRHLGRRALRDEHDVAWIGLAYANKQWDIVPLLEDIYSGVGGTLLFLAQLDAVADEPEAGELARRGMDTFRRRLTYTREGLASIGGFNGWGGILYMLSHLYALWGDERLLRDAEDVLQLLPDLVEEDIDLDVVGGCAGLIGGLLSMQAVAPDERWIETARRCGDRLIEQASPMEVGLGWFTRIQTDKPINGYSHGGAGIAWALVELFRATGDERYRDTALQAILYEDTQYVPESGNWLDAKDHSKMAQGLAAETTEALSLAWCYGAPGIGMARQRCQDVLDHPALATDVDNALRTTLERGFGRNHCICHGDLGNLDFVHQVAEARGDADLRAEVALRLTNVLASIEKDGWVCGIPLGVESPALMNGLTGIGLGLLHLVAPERVPSVLRMEPPRERTGR